MNLFYKQKILLLLGTVAAAANGISMPLFSLIFGEMTDSFAPTSTPDGVVKNAGRQSIWFLVVGIGTFICSWIMFATWIISGERQAIQYRRKYFEAILKQEIGWFDSINPNELATRVAQQTFDVQGAIGEKVPTFIMTIFMTLGGFVVGYIRGWELSLVCTAALPVVALSMFFFTLVLQNSSNKTAESYEKAGGFAEQAITGVKTVKSLRGEDFEVDRYSGYIREAMNISLSYAKFVGFAMGFIFWAVFADYALGFWYGSVLVEEKTQNSIYGRPYSVGDVLVIFFAIQIGGFSLGQAAPCLDNFSKGKTAGYKIFQVLNREPLIKNTHKGQHIDNLKGEFTFNNVEFNYPAKPDIPILKGISLVIEAGKKTSFVGESGSGKSTCLQLIERFYDVNRGELLIDGRNIQHIDLDWLRENIGYVGQEPVLFATTIRENLRYGKKDATEQEMWDALEKANAKTFIQNLEKQLDTFVGSAGSQFSGGQKQRICIARAILKNPKILLLDEATSALDRANEMSIQKTLDNVSKGRTTICVAHRLTTVQNSDKIIVLDRGVVVEQGKHGELISKGGKYEALAKNQLQGELEESLNQISVFLKNRKRKPSAGNEIVVQTDFSEEIIRLSDALQVIKQNARIEGKSPEDYLVQHIGKENAEFQIQELQKVVDDLSQQRVPVEGFSDIINMAVQLANEYRKEKGDEQEQNDELGQLKPIALRKKSSNQQSHKEEHQGEVRIRVESKQIDKGVNKEQKAIEDQKALKEQEKKDQIILKRLFTYNQPEKGIFYLGILFALGNGVCFPLSALIMSEMIWVLSQAAGGDIQSGFREDANRLTYYFIGIAFASLFFFGGMQILFARVGEGLTYRLRKDGFSKIMKMPIQWFDIPENNPGTLAVRLGSEAKLVNSLTSNVIGLQVSNISSLITGMAIAFTYSWSITLISLGLSPLMILSGQLQAQFVQGFSSQTDEAYKDSGNLIQEAVTNIRTVSSFGNEQILLGFLNERLKKPAALIPKKANMAGISLGVSYFAMFGIYSLIFYIGAIFHREYDLNMRDMFAAIFAVMFASMGAGNNNQFMADVGAAKNAARSIFKLFDSEDEVQLHEKKTSGKQLVKKDKIQGNIQFKNVSFTYPSRNKLILDQVSFEIKAGNKAAFVGPSGCGKSTIMQLLLRFYYPDSGEILLDGINIEDYDLSSLRSYFGVVSQEPVVFNGTIKENIQYNTKNISTEEIKQASIQANALGFIERDELEDQFQDKKQQQVSGKGFDRQVGAKGSQISGGQKQRLAIARAILKQPQILLLDEATSALDAENEKIVQDSLDRLMQNKTSLAIAHRISTIKDSDVIFVMEEGRIKEQGNYNHLISLKGYFYRLEKGDSH